MAFVERGRNERRELSRLRHLSDWRHLISISERIYESTPNRLIKLRMMEVLKKETDWETLVSMKGETRYNSDPRRFVEARMAEVLPDILPYIFDWKIIFSMWQKTARGSESEKLIEARMADIYKDTLPSIVSKETIPDWIEDMVKENNVPLFLDRFALEKRLEYMM